jgi:hypothetical protein
LQLSSWGPVFSTIEQCPTHLKEFVDVTNAKDRGGEMSIKVKRFS